MDDKQPHGQILYIGADPTHLESVQTTLEAHGFTFHSIANARESFVLARTSRPDLILLDIALDGFNVCASFKATRQLRDIPIILVSEQYDDQENARAMDVGAVDYVAKQDAHSDLSVRIELHHRNQQCQRENQALHAHLEQLNRELIERKQTEAAHPEHDQAGQADHEELNMIMATIVHDFRFCLGLIVNYATALEQDYDDLTKEQHQQFLQEIRTTSVSTSDMLNTLDLSYRANNAEMSAEPINMAQPVTRAQRRLTRRIKTSQAVISVPDEWPTALGDGWWLEEAWSNLISDALKHGSAPPQIELGSASHDEYVEFWIRRHSSGLTDWELTRVFPPVTHRRFWSTQGPVRLIIEKLNGTVRVNTVPGHATTFYFILPSA